MQSLPDAFVSVASGLIVAKLRFDYHHHLLALCFGMGLVAKSNIGKYTRNY